MNLFRPSHVIFLPIVIILLFGYRKLPNIARNVDQSIKIFKKEVRELHDDGSKNSQTQIQQPQEGTYYTGPTQSDQTAQSAEGSPQK